MDLLPSDETPSRDDDDEISVPTIGPQPITTCLGRLVAISGLWPDEQAYMSQLEAAWTLDAALQPLDRLTVTSARSLDRS